MLTSLSSSERPLTNPLPTELLIETSEIADTSLNMVTAVAGEIAASHVVSGLSKAPRFHDRLIHSRFGRAALSTLMAIGVLSGSALEASPALADSNPVYTVVNPDKDSTKNIYDRNSPSWNDTSRTYPDFSYYGDRLKLICGTSGEAVGPRNNKRWHYAENISRPEAGTTWIPDYYMNTPNKANQPTPGETECGTPTAQPEVSKPVPNVKGCYFNLKAPSKNLTFSYDGDHRYLGNAWQAAKNWTNVDAGIIISQTSTNNAYIKFKDVYITEPTVIDGVHLGGGTLGANLIPEDTSWMGPHKTIPKNPHHPKSITILVNQYAMDKIEGDAKKKDFYRTYALTHEIGHALGLGHPDRLCGHSDTSIMEEGDDNTFERNFNTPTNFDKLELEQLYKQ